MNSVNVGEKTYTHKEGALQKADLRGSRISFLLQIETSKEKTWCKAEPWGSVPEFGMYTEWDNQTIILKKKGEQVMYSGSSQS